MELVDFLELFDVNTTTEALVEHQPADDYETALVLKYGRENHVSWRYLAVMERNLRELLSLYVGRGTTTDADLKHAYFRVVWSFPTESAMRRMRAYTSTKEGERIGL